MCNVQHNTLIQDKNMLQVITLTANVEKDLTTRQQQLSLIIPSLNSSVYTLLHNDNIQRTAPYTPVKRNGLYRLFCVTKAICSNQWDDIQKITATYGRLRNRKIPVS
jgi:hypothetical protein